MFRSIIFRMVAAMVLAVPLVMAGCGSGSTPAPRPVPVANVSKWIESIKTSDRIGVRQLACMKLGELGSAASEAIPTLEDAAANDPSPKVQEAAKEALAKIRGG